VFVNKRKIKSSGTWAWGGSLTRAAVFGGFVGALRHGRRSRYGRILKGFSGNPAGRPPGRVSMRVAFHKHGLEHLAKLSELADDPRLTPGERAVVHAEFVRLSYSLRCIRSDASSKRKVVQQERERELHAATLAVFARAGVPAREFFEWREAKSKPGTPPAPPLPKAPAGEAKAQPVGEAQIPPEGDGEARPGEAPQRPFRISLPA
jgi:hypothetical protein